MIIDTVLLVDDEDDIRAIAEVSLQALGGWRVEQATNGFDAVEQARRRPPDVILLDMMMPGMDGLGTLQQLRATAETQRIPVVFMTAKVQPVEVQGYLEAGAVGVIAKPFDPMTLADEIRRIAATLP